MGSVGSAYEQPMTVTTVDGEVVVLGPAPLAVALTPEAAEESARRLAAAAEQARRESRPPPD